jgi:hypothetical protein
MHSEYKYGNIDISYVQTCDNLADIFTKPLPLAQFVYLMDSILGSHSNAFALDDRPPNSCAVTDETSNDDLYMEHSCQD